MSKRWTQANERASDRQQQETQMRSKRVLDMKCLDSRLLGLIGAGFGLILIVAIFGSSSRAHAVVPATEPVLVSNATAPVAPPTDLPAVERHNEVARADMQVVRLESVGIVARRSEIAAARAAGGSARDSVASSEIAGNLAAAAR